MSSYPRLSSHAAHGLFDRLIFEIESKQHSSKHESLPPEVSYVELTRDNITSSHLARLREGVENIATEFGFPDTPITSQKGNFDRAITHWCKESGLLNSSDLINNDVWTALSFSLWADIIYWRFGTTENRYVGSRKNMIQRCWQRAMSLDKGEEAADRWEYVDGLGEDDLVQLMERTVIGLNKILATSFAKITIARCKELNANDRKEAIRSATKKIRALNTVIDLSALPDVGLIEFHLEEIYDNLLGVDE